MTEPARYGPPRLTLLTLLAFVLLFGCQREPSPVVPPPADDTTPLPTDGAPMEAAAYVGSEACAGCHAAAYDAWQGSHHDLALQAANADTVLGHFPARFGSTEFQRDADTFHIRPDSAPGRLEVSDDLRIRFTFGVTPLQQYVVPAADGALQTFPIAWDSRPAASGGQRWYALYDGDYPSGDPMHWTGRANRWNSQCADCHSTGVVKGYDPRTRRYQTTWAVEDVGCEACHGPGSRHVAEPVASPLPALASQAEEINACAACHSRRSQIAEGFLPDTPLLDHYRPQLIAPGLYQVDGQIEDEVYVFGSFLQSRMHHAGVTCSNCHEAHSATVRRPGNATCTFCHQSAVDGPFAELAGGDYDTPAHHFHPADSAGAQCVNCHMPAKVYMGVDERRDHSFRIPRPDLAVDLGVSEPCTACHEDRTAAWAAAEIRTRFGPDRPAHFATTFAAADRGEANADAALAALVADADQPIMVRASALAKLGAYQRGYTLDAIRSARNGEALLRMAVPLAADSLAPESRWRLLAPLLTDPLRAVRQQTVTALIPTLAADPVYRNRLLPYLETWIDEQALNLDFPEVLTNVAGAYAALGRTGDAEAALEEALRQQSNWIPGLMNLADLYRATGREAEAGALLEKALIEAPEAPDVIYGYGLWLSRHGRLDESVALFERAAALAPDRRRFAYAWAIALNDSGAGPRAVEVLTGLLERWPEDEQLLIAAVTMLRDQGRFSEALVYLDRLLVLRPTDAQLLRFREALAQAAASA